MQLKGVACDVADPAPEDLARAQVHLDAFVAEAQQVGVPPDGTRRLFGPSFVAVEVEVGEVYDQTPGPGAGTRP
jgi:hypothetical protein